MLRRERAARRERAEDPVARSHDVRLDHEVAVRGSTSGVGRHGIVDTGDRAEVVHRPDRQHQRVVSGSVDRQAPITSAVAGRGDDDQALRPSAAHGDVDRIVLDRHARCVAQREVDDLDAVLVLVLDRPVDGLEDLGQVSLPLVVECSQDDQLRFGCHTVLTGDDPCNVSPVSEAVVSGTSLVDEVDTRDDPLLGHRDARRDAGVDQRHRHAAAGEAVALVGEIGTGRHAGHVEIRSEQPVRRDRQNPRRLREASESLRTHVRHDGAQRRGVGPLAESCRAARERSSGLHLDDDGHGRALRQREALEVLRDDGSRTLGERHTKTGEQHEQRQHPDDSSTCLHLRVPPAAGRHAPTHRNLLQPSVLQGARHLAQAIN